MLRDEEDCCSPVDGSGSAAFESRRAAVGSCVEHQQRAAAAGGAGWSGESDSAGVSPGSATQSDAMVNARIGGHQCLGEGRTPALFELRSRDVYGRLVGRLLIDGQDLGAALISKGVVFAWDGFLGRCDDLDYPSLEREAASAERGVWSAQPPLQRPWNVMERERGGEP